MYPSGASRLFEHLCQEFKVLELTNLELTQELHRLQAYLSHYQQLLEDFQLSVEFVRDTPNPAMSVLASTKERVDSMVLLRKEAGNLIFEIERLRGQRKIMFDRVQNAIHLVRICRPRFILSAPLTLIFKATATVNIGDGMRIRALMVSKLRRTVWVKQVFLMLPSLCSVLSNVNRDSLPRIHLLPGDFPGCRFALSHTCYDLLPIECVQDENSPVRARYDGNTRPLRRGCHWYHTISMVASNSIPVRQCFPPARYRDLATSLIAHVPRVQSDSIQNAVREYYVSPTSNVASNAVFYIGGDSESRRIKVFVDQSHRILSVVVPDKQT